MYDANSSIDVKWPDGSKIYIIQIPMLCDSDDAPGTKYARAHTLTHRHTKKKKLVWQANKHFIFCQEH